MANQKIEVDFVGKSLALRMSNPTTGVTGNWEYYPVCNFVSLNGQALLGFATRDVLTNQRRQRYQHDNMTKVFIETNGTHQIDIMFELNDVINQPGWTPDFGGMEQAKLDINSWIAQCSDPSGAPAGGATEASLLNLIALTDNAKDFEIKLVKDTGAANQIIKEIQSIDVDSGLKTISYEDVNGAPYVPVGPLLYMDPEAVLQLVNANLTPTTYTHNPVVTSGPGNIPVGARRGSVLNIGGANGTWGGQVLAPGIGIPFGGAGFNGTLSAAIAYDATGTTFVIEYDL